MWPPEKGHIPKLFIKGIERKKGSRCPFGEIRFGFKIARSGMPLVEIGSNLLRKLRRFGDQTVIDRRSRSIAVDWWAFFHLNLPKVA